MQTDAAIDLGDARTSGAYILSKLQATQSTGTVAPDIGTASMQQRLGSPTIAAPERWRLNSRKLSANQCRRPAKAQNHGLSLKRSRYLTPSSRNF